MTDRFRLVLIILILGAFVVPGRILATNNLSDQSQVAMSVPTPTPVQYDLPVPGMLTNNPVYFLKRFRDYLLETFIRDPVKKVEFDILQEDKFLNMAMELAQQKKWDDIRVPLDLAYVYNQKARQDIEELKSKNIQYPGHLKENLVDSMLKHVEVVSGLDSQAPAQLKKYLQEDTDRYHSNLPKIEQL